MRSRTVRNCLPVTLLLILCLSAVLLFAACTGANKTPDGTDPVSGDITGTPTEPTTRSPEPDTDPATEAETLAVTQPESEPVTTPFVTRPRPVLEPWEDETEEVVKKQIDLIDESLASFDALDNKGLSAAHWSTPFGGKMTVEQDETDGNRYLRFSGISQSWTSAAYDLFPAIQTEGTYTVTLRYMAEGDIPANVSPFHICVRGTRPNDFMANAGGNVFVNMVDCPSGCEAGKWYTATFTFRVSSSDLAEKDTWNLCFHEINKSVTAICMDDVNISYYEVTDPAPSFPTTTQTWIATEFVLNASVYRENPLFEAELDLILTSGETSLTVPGFWDGGNTWRVRFALPFAGEWTWRTVCTDTSDTGLHGLSGSITCTPYDGNLDIYKHGFVGVREGDRYFTYADGTPFFYLGDTHWTLFTEEYDAPGDHAGDTGAQSHFKYIIDKRVEQGFTVIQSEPIGSGINVTNGITASDVSYFQRMDKYFAYIAGLGLVHANAQFFYPADMESWCKSANFDEELRVAARYWVARYSAYPVLWTLGQEVDKDFYTHFDTATNPYHKLCELMDRYDPMKHPITAHQESTYYTKASDSSFRDLTGHVWYGAQWSPELTDQVRFATPKDFWNNGQNKPVILYESLYDYLWTNHFGARAEGWLAFLNGMYGYGYGAIDIWYYHSTYDMDTDSNQHGILITAQDKKAPWSDSVDYESAWQTGYMSDFFYNLEWWKLTPRFDDTDWFRRRGRCLYSVASDGNDTYVLYFYGSASNLTGTVNGMDKDATYTMWWFNPRTGAWSDPTAVTAPDGSYEAPSKPDEGDWVMLLRKNEVK